MKTQNAQVNTEDGILHVGNYVHTPYLRLTDPKSGQRAEAVDVFLPKHEMDYQDKLYALYLLENPRKNVLLHYTQADLGVESAQVIRKPDEELNYATFQTGSPEMHRIGFSMPHNVWTVLALFSACLAGIWVYLAGSAGILDLNLFWGPAVKFYGLSVVFMMLAMWRDNHAT